MTWSNKTRQERGYGVAWGRARKAVMARDCRLCQPCLRKKPQRVTVATEVDHIVPKAKGGTDELTNLQAICGECHKDKTVRDSGGNPKPVIGLDGWAL